MILQGILNNKGKELHSVDELINLLENMGYDVLDADMNYGFGSLNVIDTEMSDGEDFEIYYEISKGEFQRIIVKR